MKPAGCIFVVLMAAALSGCGRQLDPAWLQDRPVTFLSDKRKSLSVPEGMIFYDRSPATRGIGFPVGTYSLEAEDADYLYFRAATPLDFHVFKNGKLSEARRIHGGIMLAKRFNLIPAAGYIDGEGAKKFAVWKLGREFLAQKGSFWTATLE